MLRIAALNECDSGEAEADEQDEPTTTKEAEEAEAFTMYNKALVLQRSGDSKRAEELFSSLLLHPFLQKARQIAEAEEEDSHHPGLPLLYLVHKNMAAAAVTRGDLVDAMKSYLEAVKIDASEVTVWYKMGTVAKQLHNYPLARLAFEQGLQCNGRHWPSLDAVITVLYALNDYLMCLDYCERALEYDPYYTKGLVFLRQIMKEQPSLQNDTKELFSYCDPVIYTVPVEEAEAEKMIKECVAIRDKRRELAKVDPPAPLKLPTPITKLTWKCVGECLVELYDDFTSSDPPKSLALALDMSDYTAMAEGRVDQIEGKELSCVVPASATTKAADLPTVITVTSAASDSMVVPVPGGSVEKPAEQRCVEKMEVESASAPAHLVSGGALDSKTSTQAEQTVSSKDSGFGPAPLSHKRGDNSAEHSTAEKSKASNPAVSAVEGTSPEPKAMETDSIARQTVSDVMQATGTEVRVEQRRDFEPRTDKAFQTDSKMSSIVSGTNTKPLLSDTLKADDSISGTVGARSLVSVTESGHSPASSRLVVEVVGQDLAPASVNLIPGGAVPVTTKKEVSGDVTAVSASQAAEAQGSSDIVTLDPAAESKVIKDLSGDAAQVAPSKPTADGGIPQRTTSVVSVRVQETVAVSSGSTVATSAGVSDPVGSFSSSLISTHQPGPMPPILTSLIKRMTGAGVADAESGYGFPISSHVGFPKKECSVMTSEAPSGLLQNLAASSSLLQQKPETASVGTTLQVSQSSPISVVHSLPSVSIIPPTAQPMPTCVTSQPLLSVLVSTPPSVCSAAAAVSDSDSHAAQSHSTVASSVSSATSRSASPAVHTPTLADGGSLYPVLTSSASVSSASVSVSNPLPLPASRPSTSPVLVSSPAGVLTASRSSASPTPLVNVTATPPSVSSNIAVVVPACGSPVSARPTSSAVDGSSFGAGRSSSSPKPSSSARTAVSPSLPKFQFNTITSSEVQALLHDCKPTTPLLSTPAPSPYSASLLERFRQTPPTSQVPPQSSPSSAASQLQSLARLANLTSAVATLDTEMVTSPAVLSAEQTPKANGSPRLSPSRQQQSALSPMSVSAQVALQDHVGLGRGGRGTRRGAKRKRAAPEKVIGPEDFSVKRRSARVANTRKEEENVDFQKLLRNFLPSSLTQLVSEEEDPQLEDLSMSASQAPVDVVVTDLCSGPPLEESETEDVRNYLKECLESQGVIGLMYKYLVYLSTRDTRLWPAGVAELYLKVYERIRPHLTFPSLYFMDFPEICYTEISKMSLVWSELTLGVYLAKRAATVQSPVMVQRQTEGSSSETGLFKDSSSEEDLLFLTGMVETGLVDLFGSAQSQFTVRVYWLKGRLALAENQMDTAVDTLDMVGSCLREEDAVNKVYLPNCSQDKVISLDEVKRQQESLQRCQSLEETQRLFDTGQYQQVVDSLTATFAPAQSMHRGVKVALPERHAQLELLQDALYRLEDWLKCLQWSEVALDEALRHYRRAPTPPLRDSWAGTLVRLFEGLQRVMDKAMQTLQSVPVRNIIRLTHNLMRIIEINHDVSEAVTDMPIASVLPWILLYRIIQHEEDRLETLKIAADDSSEVAQGTISSSLMLLNIAHEYLGRNAWCTRESGTFLHFYMDILRKKLSSGHGSVKRDLKTAFEQCVFCLYGHPNKKGKARHLFDHNAACVDLTWERCEAVFDYFKPESLPEFDSYKTSTVSAELENLLRRIYSLIPKSDEPDKRVEEVHDYIEGNTNKPPVFSTTSRICQELYYLLADYYFKNKEQPKAIKFYTFDVCFNSWRIDSWAGLALAKMSQLEQKLNSMELKIDTPLHKKSITALRCFSRAVEIDESVRKLWIEYGALAYQLHSHASRQLRMEKWFHLSDELKDIAMETRVEMLATARNCYWKASKCEAEGSEEEWLHHYMMGKVMEKKRAHPRLYLEHYKQAAIYLHEEEAKYPPKIMYHVSAPHLSLEALEMYYRLHVAVMKHLLRISTPETKDDMTLFDRYVTEATESPFAQRKEKHYETQESVSSADDSQSSAFSVPPYSTAHQRPVYHMTPQDHNYSKQKSSGGETSDASCEVKETTGTETDGSQSSEETDATLKTSGVISQRSAAGAAQQPAGPADDKAVRKSDATVAGDDGRKQQSSQVEMMELHAETDSQVTGELVDTKPLLFDKQVSFGFLPVLDKCQDARGHSATPTLPQIPTDTTSYTAVVPAATPSTPIVTIVATSTVTATVAISVSTSATTSSTSATASATTGSTSAAAAVTASSSLSAAVVASSSAAVATAPGSPSIVTSVAAGAAGGAVSVLLQGPKQKQEVADASKADNSILLVDKIEGEMPMEVDIIGDQKESENTVAEKISSQSGGFRQMETDFGDKESVSDDQASIVAEEESQPSEENSNKHDLAADTSSKYAAGSQELIKSSKTTGEDRDKSADDSISPGETGLEDNLKTTRETEPIIIILSSEDETSSKFSPQKRMLQTSPERSKRARLDDGAAKEETGGGETKDELTPESEVRITSTPARMEVDKETNSKTSEKLQSVQGLSVASPQSDLELLELTPHRVLENKASLTAAEKEMGASKSAVAEKKLDDSENRLEKRAVSEVGDFESGQGGKAESGPEAAEHESKQSGVVEMRASGEQSTPAMSQETIITSQRTSAKSTDKDVSDAGKLQQTKDTENVQQTEFSAGETPQPKQRTQQTMNEGKEEKESLSKHPQSECGSQPSASLGEGNTTKTQESNKPTEELCNPPQTSATKQNSLVTQASNQPSQSTVAEDSSTTNDPNKPSQKPEIKKMRQEANKVPPVADDGVPSQPAPVLLGEEEYREWKKKLLDKCVEGLHLCLSRFPTHYKSIYRLAYLFYASDSHRNLESARDLLLGNTDWQNLNHMPANGLFSDRKANNFFNGMWKIPIDEIDRSGSFASHVNRSVQLLLEVLRDLGDVSMLMTLHTQLKKKPPDQGRKYLRDGERQFLAQMAHNYTLDAVAKQLSRPESEVNKVEVLLTAYKVYNSHRHGMEAKRAKMILLAAYQWLGLPQREYGSPLEQAIQYCNLLITAQSQAQKAEKSRLLSQSTNSNSASTPASTLASTSMDIGGIPATSVPTAIVKPFSQTAGLTAHGGQSAGLSMVSGGSQTSTPAFPPYPAFAGGSRLNQAGTSTTSGSHPMYTSGVQASTLRPAHTRPRTMSVSRGEMPAALDLSALTHQMPTSVALDLSSSSRQTTAISASRVLDLTSPGRRATVGSATGRSESRPEVIDLTSPERNVGPRRSLQVTSPGSAQRIPAFDVRSPLALHSQAVGPSQPGLSPRGLSRTPVVDLTTSAPQGVPPLGSLRSPGSVRASGFVPRHQPIAHSTPSQAHHPQSPFSSPFRPSSSATSSPATPRLPISTADEASDIDLTSDQGDDLALTSPDRLTSDVRHHFHGDLL